MLDRQVSLVTSQSNYTAATTASATAWSFSTELSLIPIALIMSPALLVRRIPPEKVINPLLECSIFNKEPPS